MNEFKLFKGNYTKTCTKCLDTNKKSLEKNKCKHNRQKERCKDCKGASICKHNQQKPACKECNDPIKLTIKNWLSHSKANDIKFNRYKNDDYITYESCLDLVKFYINCFHCHIKLQYINYQDDLATIERLDDSLEHNKKNCVLACMKCNKKRLTNK